MKRHALIGWLACMMLGAAWEWAPVAIGRTYNPRGDARAAGSSEFDGGGHHGQCSFSVQVNVQDMARLMGRPPQ